ncbi:MAG: hypothetical protein C0601_04855 [Candidatus Muiribacterium halophilum]|uniref:Motility protein n=1 Tax=Muiribacterium halophilum TaxID=2053465 RepID=A0A2N5ZI16_MUIH1|nr:MAG: hypothetical protein C0601_04855 [Candidatus Muirbacterium halophilum]
MRIAGDLNQLQSGGVQNSIQVNMLKKSLDLSEKTSSDLLSSLVESMQGIQQSSPLGKNVDFYA